MSSQPSGSYRVPDLLPGTSFDLETEVKRSRFLAFMSRVTSRAEALSFQQSLKKQFPDASHHCLAFVAGPPEGNTVIGFDDDGEPGGTAGKPMLNVLQHRQIGEIAAVVVRYFGGIKLGAGGLVRAYGASVQAACEVLPVTLCVAMATGRAELDYSSEQPMRHLLDSFAGKVTNCHYTDKVVIAFELPDTSKDEFTIRITETLKGQISLNWQD
ncbi:YigZ family protein [Endozoicomonas arenosclerae]|uniref:YigZ family protein n=1 Tax=Endozoicomonas arenosclerae TaxID=1633495 RepID=UPI000781CD47|nr:YigZ family protein [Endozoicomonas arenosclerae]